MYIYNDKESTNKMYITYEKDRWSVVDNLGYIERPNCTPHYHHANIQESIKPPELDDIYGPREPTAFKPRWLVDISQMALVRGSDTRERYYTLSYSWNQSGDYFKNKDSDDYTRNDEGKHQIVFYRTKKTKAYPRGRRKTRIPMKPRLVKFEGLLQRICKDLGVRYIWWDQWCIDQSNTKVKQQEIKNMYKIYKNAYCTLVLIPELEFTGFKDHHNKPMASFEKILQAEWVKRVWTLEEAFVSKRILFVGRNVQMWSRISDGNYIPFTDAYDFFYSICTKSLKWNACIALRMVRKRTSTKAHDRFFALANMFPEKMVGLDFSYSQSLLDLMIQFYTRLAQDDPSILYFGVPETPDTQEEIRIVGTPESGSLPSWTGVSGAHAEFLFTFYQPEEIQFGILPSDYTISGTSINVTCTSISIRIDQKYTHDQSVKLDRIWNDDDQFSNIVVSHRNSLAFVAISEEIWGQYFGLKVTHFLPLKDEAGTTVNTPLSFPTINGGVLSLTEDCTHCTVLFGLFYSVARSRVSPVVMRKGSNYKAIGCCILRTDAEYHDIDTETKQTFVIT